jgi:4-hydroxythreonine-4-phosphate dehydrogenase
MMTEFEPPLQARSGKPLALTMGDPAGIGPELLAQVFRLRPEWSSRCVVVGHLPTLRRAVLATGGLLPVAVLASPAEAQHLPPRCLPLLTTAQGQEHAPAWGQISAQAGHMAAEAIAYGAQLALQGQVSGLVTAPIHKEALAAAGIAQPGHTEYLQALAAGHAACSPSDLPVRMMLSNQELRTVLVSIHVSLRNALAAVTYDNVLRTLEITVKHFQRLPAWQGRPLRIAVAGLNPHAGEGGLFGTEEQEVLAPVVQQARALGWQVSGPHAPDTVFMRARRGEFDVVIAMYHDQGLIPVKYMGLDHGVNTTLGLPFVRTSPDHGTAFDLAGTGRADPSSLVAAIEAAMAATEPAP